MRGGSHNLIIGAYNSFTPSAYGGLVVGIGDQIGGAYSVAIGGNGVSAFADNSVALGGTTNVVESGADFGIIIGGKGNMVTSNVDLTGSLIDGALILGGYQNSSSGIGSITLGGEQNANNGYNDNIFGVVYPQPPFSQQ
jgi:hypothetical protein